MTRSSTRAASVLVATIALVSAGLVTTTASAVPDPIIQGVAVDGEGHPILGVEVVAEEDGEAAASDLTYENTDAAGDPQPGYFALHVTKGTYTVTLSKKNYETVEIDGVRIAKGHRIASLGEITLRRASETSGKLVDDSITVDDKGKVKVTVTPGKPTGDVVVKDGSKTVGSGKLKAKDKGQTTITLSKLKKGKHELKVVYDGSSVLAGSSSGKLVLDVKAAKKDRQRPNALTYVG